MGFGRLLGLFEGHKVPPIHILPNREFHVHGIYPSSVENTFLSVQIFVNRCRPHSKPFLPASRRRQQRQRGRHPSAKPSAAVKGKTRAGVPRFSFACTGSSCSCFPAISRRQELVNFVIYGVKSTYREPKSGSEKLRRGDLERTASVRRVRLPPPRRRLA